jgi:outer membrane protein assembly factor BamB
MKNLISGFFTVLLLTACKAKNTETLALIASVNAVSPKTPKAIFISETLDLTHCESAVYNEKNNTIYASLIGKRDPGDGSIASITVDGKIMNAKFIEGLNDPKGIAITKDKLYVSDVTELVEADLATGKILKKHTAVGVQFLNDVAADGSGNVYASDTRTSEIYKLDTDGNFNLWLAEISLDRPNGLLIENNMMFVASWGSVPEGGRISKIDMTTKTINSVSGIIGNLDGIQVFDTDRKLISDWQSGNVHLIDAYGKTELILTAGQSVGDIAFIKEKGLLLLPMNKQSRLLFYKLE